MSDTTITTARKAKKTRRQVVYRWGVCSLCFQSSGILLSNAGLLRFPGVVIQTLFDRNEFLSCGVRTVWQRFASSDYRFAALLSIALEKGAHADVWIKTNLNPTQDRWVEVWYIRNLLCILKSREVEHEEARNFCERSGPPFNAGVAIEKKTE